MTEPDIITADHVEAAKARLDGHAVKTPLLESKALNAIAGRRILCKAEILQHTGSFKYRGAFNRLVQMSPDERARGVVAFSSGNHAQGVARAARELGISAVIVMPADAPEVKCGGVVADGAKIISYDRLSESREAMAAQISAREGRIIVPSYDDPYIIAGQGTVGLEIAAQAKAMGAQLSGVIICMGGGGLCAGSSLALARHAPGVKVFGAEPADYDDHKRSFETGTRQANVNPPDSLCDALMTPMPGELTWAINSRHLSGVFGITDEECLLTMALAKQHLDVTLEPGGAVALAAALSGKLPEYMGDVAVTLSGGNVDPAVVVKAMKLL